MRRGVDVRVITPNIPDKKHVKWMTEYYYGELLKCGIRIYEYTPGFVHSKVVLEEHCAVVGTINMDYRSFYLHYENGIWIYNEEFLQEVRKDFDETFRVSREITYEEVEKPPDQTTDHATLFESIFDAGIGGNRSDTFYQRTAGYGGRTADCCRKPGNRI